MAKPRKARAATDVRHPLPRLQQLGDRGAVQKMAVPQPLDFAGSDESPLDSHVRQQPRVALGDTDPVAEDLARGIGRWWYYDYSAVTGIDMFHVKHPLPSCRWRRAPELHRCNSVVVQSTKTTTRRPGSTPSLSL